MSKKDLSGIGISLDDEYPAQPMVDSDQEVQEKPKKNFNKYNRTVTNEDILKYEPMVEKYIRDNVAKNWNEANTKRGQGDNSLGNTGMSLNDIRQDLRREVLIALYNYNPDYRTKEGRSVKESTFVFQHLWNRVGQMMKRLTKAKMGYGKWHSNIEETLWETDRD